MMNSSEPLEGAPLIAPSSTDHPLFDQVVEACRTVYDPEIPVNIYDLGLIYTIDISAENVVSITMTLTAPGCPVAGEMPGWVADAISGRHQAGRCQPRLGTALGDGHDERRSPP